MKTSSFKEDEELDEEKKCNQEQLVQPLLTSFFHHLSTILCEASSSQPYQLQFVLAVPISHTFTPGQVRLYASHVQRSITYLNKQKKKQPNNSKHYINNQHSKTENNVLAVITEPVAVCMAHGLLISTSSATYSFPPPPPSWNTCFVLDWGASGLTITNLQRINSLTDMVTITSHAHDTTISGERIIDLVLQHVIQQFERKHRLTSVSKTLPIKAHSQLHAVCNHALKTLVRTSTTHITIDSFFEGIDLVVPLSRPRLDMIVAPFLQRMEQIVLAELLKITYIPAATDRNSILDIILLSGGVCEMPSVKERVQKMFPNAWKGNPSCPTDEVVAVGCAAYAQDILQSIQSKTNASVATASCQLCVDHPMFPLLTLQQSVVPSPYGIGFIWSNQNDESATVNPLIVQPLIPVGTPLPTLISKSIPWQIHSNTSTFAADDTMPEHSLPTMIGIVAFQGVAEDARLLAKLPIDWHNKNKNEMVALVLELTEYGKLSLWINGRDPIILIE
jgi:molecular chaperone DnaK (HSP70)